MLQSARPIVDRKIRIALVGCGRISANHIRSIAAHHDRAELVVICDYQQDRLQKALNLVAESAESVSTELITPTTFFDYNEMLSAIQNKDILVDLVVLTTPSGLHSIQAIAAAKIGLHVCTEKPMATRWEDGKAMVRECDKAGVNLFVVKQNRFNSTLRLVKRQLKAGRFGKLSMVSVNVFWQRPQSYYDQDSWRGTWEFDGGALMNQASHYIDLLDWLIGPVESISASIATIGRDIEVEDTAALQLKWRNGALGTMAVTMLTFPKNLEGSITILGDQGTVRIGGPAVNQIEHWSFMNSSPDDGLVADASYQTTSVYGFGHPPYYENIIDALTGKGIPECCGREGLKSLELLAGAYISARDKKITYFPLEY
jgi:UDP-N-acetyl-2-amino-2-deoxyglucuronate dehydrogenase|tara:strand:+ start:683 stop:1795 length:1113 start_codon:yes stop_codon:yes gene_type:complete